MHTNLRPTIQPSFYLRQTKPDTECNTFQRTTAHTTIRNMIWHSWMPVTESQLDWANTGKTTRMEQYEKGWTGCKQKLRDGMIRGESNLANRFSIRKRCVAIIHIIFSWIELGKFQNEILFVSCFSGNEDLRFLRGFSSGITFYAMPVSYGCGRL